METEEIKFIIQVALSSEKSKLTLPKRTTILELKDICRKNLELPTGVIFLVYNGKILSDLQSLESIGLEEKETIYLSVREKRPPKGLPKIRESPPEKPVAKKTQPPVTKETQPPEKASESKDEQTMEEILARSFKPIKGKELENSEEMKDNEPENAPVEKQYKLKDIQSMPEIEKNPQIVERMKKILNSAKESNEMIVLMQKLFGNSDTREDFYDKNNQLRNIIQSNPGAAERFQNPIQVMSALKKTREMVENFSTGVQRELPPQSSSDDFGMLDINKFKDKIEKLKKMGLADENLIKQILLQSGGDINKAAEMLLNQIAR